MKKLFLLIFSVTFLFSFSNHSFSQPKEGETLEKIIAVVGSEVITLSDLNASLQIMAQTHPNMDVPDSEKQRVYDSLINDSDMRKRVLDALINEKLVVAKAMEDSVTVTDDEIEQRWEYQLQQYIGQFGSEKRIEDIFGMSLSQIVKFVDASYKAKEEVYNLAKIVRDSIVAGGDFAAFAKNYSNDLATATNGGELGWFPKGKLIREFERAAFELQPGQISLPVETPFGFHIIQAIEKKKDSILTRHILFKIGGTSEDVDRAKDLLKSIKDSMSSGKSFEDLAKLYSDEKETKGFGGYIAKTSLQKLPPEIRGIVEKLSDGSISEPIVYITDKSKSAFHIIYRKRTIPSHFPTLENDRKDIEEMALNFKKINQYEAWIEELRSQLYWEVKE